MPDRPQRSRKEFADYFEYAARLLLASGITADQIECMRQFGLMARDAVTGYYEGRSGNGRLWTLEEAVRHVRQTGEEAYYVEMDLQNLGGLNAALGHTGANEVYSAVAAVARRELSAVASEAAFFRHGGDETCAFLVNTGRRAVGAALDRVRRDVAKLAAEFGVNDIPHPKHRGSGEFRGIGVHSGMVRVSARHGDDPTLVFRDADIELERNKGGRRRGHLGTDRSRPLFSQVAARANKAPRPV